MIAIIGACGSNLTSVLFAIQRLGYTAKITNDVDEINQASHVVLPGVGTAQWVMQQLERYQLIDCILNLTQPVLGICLGMQILFESSSEGNVKTLGVIPGKITTLKNPKNSPLPHMGWNKIQICDYNLFLSEELSQQYFYFVHSFSAPVNEATLATCRYGEEFAAIVGRHNFYGVQFHPERSGEKGALLLKQFFSLEENEVFNSKLSLTAKECSNNKADQPLKQR